MITNSPSVIFSKNFSTSGEYGKKKYSTYSCQIICAEKSLFWTGGGSQHQVIVEVISHKRENACEYCDAPYCEHRIY